MNRCLFILLALGAFSQVSAADYTVRDTTATRFETTGVRVARGKVDLPTDGRWVVGNPFQEQSGLTEIYLERPIESQDAAQGNRMGRMQDRRAIRTRRQLLASFYWACDDYSRENKGVGPEKIGDLTTNDEKSSRRHLSKDSFAGIHLIPGIRLFRDPKDRQSRVEPPELIAFDTTPAIDDGKHWIMMTNGQSTRVAIEKALLEKYSLNIKATQKPHHERATDVSRSVPYQIYCRLVQGHGAARVTLFDLASGKTLELHWDTTSAPEADQPHHQAWAKLRLQHLYHSLRRDAPVGNHWARHLPKQYKIDSSIPDWTDPNNRQGRTASAMGVLGGRAAIQETLQMRRLRTPEGTTTERTIPISELQGVEVKSHPFEEMLDEAEGGELALADWVPHDRFMAYFPRPKGLFQLLEGGSKFLFQSGSTFTGRHASYRLKERYLDRLGMPETLLERFLATGAITELAIVLPDLFLIDGTELTIVARTKNPLLTAAALAVMGITQLEGTSVRKNDRGEPVYWSLRKDILIMSTSEQEAAYVQTIAENGKSLGRSAEFRYMLTQVPITSETNSYIYFSDPFIRRLVGPEMKIAQLRRLIARDELENATSAALLAKLDGWAETPNQSSLIERNYLSPVTYAGTIQLDSAFVSHSESYGSAARLRSLLANPVMSVSGPEKEAYDNYLAEYNRYWRRFFDPIAIRYEERNDGTHELSTFILPLIDSSLYSGVKALLNDSDSPLPLAVPNLDPAPVAMISFNLNEEAWLEMIDDFGDSLNQLIGLDGAILDLLGPDFHIAIHDADPVLSLGSGELQSMFGRFGGRVNSEMAWLPVVISLFTRPTSIILGLTDPEATRTLLTQMAVPASVVSEMGFGQGSLYRITDEEKWIFKYSVENLISIRFGLEIRDRFLVINNMPFSNAFDITGSVTATNNAAHLSLSPDACIQQLPALFASAVEKSRAGAMSSAACLTPLLVADVATDIATAQALHLQLFGFEPLHPAGGHWDWQNGEMVSSHYGSAWKQQQPNYDPNNQKAGIMTSVSEVNLSMQFEEDGLRSTVRWRLK